MAYGQQHNWQQNGSCLAPIYAQVEAYEGLNCSLRHSTETIDNLCGRFDNSDGLEKSNYEIIKTLDSSIAMTILMHFIQSSS